MHFVGTPNCGNTAFQTAGGTADTWGATLTPADFNAGNIGVRITQNGPTFDLDAIEMVVHHSGANLPPTVSADNASVTVSEGATANNTGTFSDPDGDAVTITASVGSIGQGAGTWSWSLSTNDGPADSTSVTITATDSDGAMGTTNFLLTVNNVAPTVAAPSVDLEPSDEGESVTASATFTDPAGALDATFTCEVDYGDGPVAGTVTGMTIEPFDDAKREAEEAAKQG